MDFSGLVANAICTSRREGRRPVKFTIIDSDSLFKPGSLPYPNLDAGMEVRHCADGVKGPRGPIWSLQGIYRECIRNLNKNPPIETYQFVVFLTFLEYVGSRWRL